MPSIQLRTSARPANKTWFAACLLVVSLGALGTARPTHADLTPGDYNGLTIEFGSLTRTYDLHVPPSYDGSAAVPLVLDFHGWQTSASLQAGWSGMKQLSDVHGFLVAFPQGYDPGGSMRSWNAGICCEPAVSAGLDDVGLARAIVAAIDAQANVNPWRVYATGLSNGAMMAHRLACEAEDTFAAVAAVAAPLSLDTVSFAACQPARPVPVLHFAGLTDTVVPYLGGVSPTFPQITLPSSPGSHAHWAAYDGCTGSPAVESFGGGASCETYETCDDGTQVGFCSLNGTGGGFLGHILYFNDDGVDVAARIWDFFTRFRLGPCECGDGIQEAACGEQCDDGNTDDGDCCSSTCTYEPASAPCPDADLCDGTEACDGSGTCQPAPPGYCDDGDACTRDTCAPEDGACSHDASPALTCDESWGKASLLVKEDVPGKEKVLAKLLRGPALGQGDLGDPLAPSGAAYTACIYDDAGVLAGRIEVDRPASQCAGQACWKAISTKGFLYKDKEASADGVQSLKLLAGDAGMSKILIKAANNSSKGQTSLPTGIAAALSGAASATLQVHGSESPACFSATLATVVKDTGALFQAKE